MSPFFGYTTTPRPKKTRQAPPLSPPSPTARLVLSLRRFKCPLTAFRVYLVAVESLFASCRACIPNHGLASHDQSWERSVILRRCPLISRLLEYSGSVSVGSSSSVLSSPITNFRGINRCGESVSHCGNDGENESATSRWSWSSTGASFGYNIGLVSLGLHHGESRFQQAMILQGTVDINEDSLLVAI